MTGRADFTDEEWDAVLEGPTSAGMIVTTAERGGTFREVYAMAKAFAEARREHGDSELLDEIVSTKPEMDRTKARSTEELREKALQRIRDGVGVVEAKATPAELADYRRFALAVANRVAGAKKESDAGPVSGAEASAIAEITEALGA
jgi:hypothetical protein